jgi:hypothetical protein
MLLAGCMKQDRRGRAMVNLALVPLLVAAVEHRAKEGTFVGMDRSAVSGGISAFRE